MTPIQSKLLNLLIGIQVLFIAVSFLLPTPFLRPIGEEQLYIQSPDDGIIQVNPKVAVLHYITKESIWDNWLFASIFIITFILTVLIKYKEKH